MKLHLKLLSILLGVLSMSAVAQAGSLPFTDIDDYAAHFESIYKMKEWGIFEGYSDGSFGYLKEINRAELSKALVLGSGMAEEEVSACADNATKSFSDVPAGEWYSDYVYCAQSKGWVSGDDGKTTFRPGDPVLVSEAFKMILESQYGTPDDSFAGSQWYDIYLNALINSKIVYQGGSEDYPYYHYTYLSNPGIGFTSDIDSKTTRQDIAELLYRIRTILEEQNGELGEYYPLLSMAEYEDEYGATVEETSSGVLTIQDPHFGFDVTNVYIGDLDPDDLAIFIEDPSAFENGGSTDWNLMVPSLHTNSYEYEELNFDEMFAVRIDGSGADAELDSWCTSKYSRPFELWEIYDTLCGEDGVATDELNSLLQLTAHGESYTGETIALDPIKNGPLSILKFNDVFAAAASHAYWYATSDELDYLESLADLQSEDSEQEAALQAWREDFVDGFFTDSDADFTSEYSELKPLLLQYERKVLLAMGDPLVLKVPLNYANSYNHMDYVEYSVGEDYEILEGDGGDYFWPTFSLKFSMANDPFQGEYFGRDQGIDTVWLQITVENNPVPFEDFDDESADWNHVAVYMHGLYKDAYYYEITSAEVVEE